MQISNEQCLVDLQQLTLYSIMNQSSSQLICEMWWKIKHIFFKVGFEMLLRQPMITVHPLCTRLMYARCQTFLTFVDQLFQDFVSPLPCPSSPPPPAQDNILRATPGTESMTVSFTVAFWVADAIKENSPKDLDTTAMSPPFPCPIAIYICIYCVLFWSNLKQDL